MDDLKLYIDRIKANEYTDFSFIGSPEIMETSEKDASYEEEIVINGSSIIANDHLVVNITIQTSAKSFCKICNEPIDFPVEIEEKHAAFALEKIKSGIFLLESYIRDLIFLHTPRFMECNNNCPERDVIKKYLTTSNDPQIEE